MNVCKPGPEPQNTTPSGTARIEIHAFNWKIGPLILYGFFNKLQTAWSLNEIAKILASYTEKHILITIDFKKQPFLSR